MKRILLVLGLVLLTSLLFADVGSDPLGQAAGELNMSRLALQVRAKLLTQARLMSQARLGPQANEPAEPEAREAPARLQERSGDCTGGCEGEPVQAQARPTPTSATPEIQARERGPQLRAWPNTRSAWTRAATTNRSVA